MKPRTRIILLSIISILIVVTIVLGVTYSFMQANIESSSVTEVSLSSCANITLTDTGESINLSNSYPMTKNRALQTTPYTFSVSSSCTDGSGFNLYLATLNTNTLSDSSIHYIITEHGNKNVIVEGILSEATNGLSDFQDYELNELNNGINGTYGSIYRLHSSGINYNTEVTYDLYLYIDESVTNETMGQTFSAGLAVKASDYDFATVDEVTVTDATNDSITISVSASAGTNAIGTYYYSINNGAYTSSSSNTYTFSGLSAGTNYSIRVYVKDTNGVDSNIYTINVETDDTVLLADYIKGLYTSQGSNGIYYHTSSLGNSAEDNSYRYAGANPNNYVCFGSDASTCPSDNLYRIIGVFGNQVKLIKNTSLGDYRWSGSSSNQSNTWSSSTLNTGTLNGTYLSGLSSTWQNKIATTNWKVGGMIQNNSATAKQYYDTEIGSSSSSTTYSAKIGLIYVSDYGFAASPDYWTTELYNYEPSKSSNWMNINFNGWTISRRSDNTSGAFRVGSSGYVDGGRYVYEISVGVLPVFYLKENVTYITGDGSKENPIQIDYKQTLADYVISQYTGTDGDNGLYYHDADLENGAADNSYRYAGANPNNYVCFGSDEETCPEDNLYRIIGVFNNEVKLIKSTSYGSYAWDSGGSNTWDATTKPDIYTTLNDTYYNSLGTTWQNKVADAIWQVGGLPNTYYNSSLKTNYDYEVGVYQTGYEETMKIGLMYVSDYVYASSSNNWTASLYDYGNSTDPNEGWLYLGTTERTISCVSGRSDYTWSVGSSGSMFNASYVIGAYAIRPVFYLNSSISYVSGSGSSTDPIRIS